MPRHKKLDDGFPYFQLVPLYPKIERRFTDFAKRRVGGLATYDNAHKPLLLLLANAYILGMKDAVDAMEYLKEPQQCHPTSNGS